MNTEESLSYPTGRFHRPSKPLEATERVQMIDRIARAPEAIGSAIRGLSDNQLDTPYRPDGWTVRQVVHHVPDSHLNSYIRFKLALTEDEPVIKPYEQTRWAELEDGKTADVGISLALLESLHKRWILLLRSLSA